MSSTPARRRTARKPRTDHIDPCRVHLWGWNTPLEEAPRALDDVVRPGWVLHVGVSDASGPGVGATPSPSGSGGRRSSARGSRATR